MRRVLVTGANKGIGFALVERILKERDDAMVVLGSRSLERGEAALAELDERHPGASERVDVVELDVSRDDSVAGAARRVGERFGREPPPLYGVVNNAGVGLDSGGLEEVLNVNTWGVRRVCDAFLPLVDPSEGRIVNVTSAAGPNFVAKCSLERQRFFVDAQNEWTDLVSLMDECLAIEGGEDAFAARGLGDGSAYGLSKALANTYTLILARHHPNLRVNACTPGFIETDLTRPRAEARGQAPAEMGMKPPEEGTRAAMFLLFGEPEGNGRYYGSDAERSPLDRYRAPGTPPYGGD